LDDLPIDRTTIPQYRLDIAGKTRSNLMPWKGQFSPQLVYALISEFSVDGQFVVDPFVGSGTTLVEAARLNRKAFGTEINPAAFNMAAIYRFINFAPPKRAALLRQCHSALVDQLDPGILVKRRAPPSDEQTKSKLLDVLDGQKDPDFRLLLEALIVRLDLDQPGLNPDRVFATWERLRATIQGLPYCERSIDLAHGDGRALPLKPNVADLVLTSPPYINVFNYHQQYRGSVESLGWDLLRVARSEIGSNRKFRGNRFLTVVQYCIDMAQVFRELHRICNDLGRVIFVVGRESNVRKTPFFNGDLVTKIAVACEGFRYVLRQERIFKNKFGLSIVEDILHFAPANASHRCDVSPLDVARDALIDAQKQAPTESQCDLKAAIDGVDSVSASPLYSTTHAHERASAT